MAMYSNVTRFTGLSGIDTESLVQQLMIAESQKLYNLQRKNTLLEWRQEAYRESHKAITGFRDTYLPSEGKNSIRLSASFKATVPTVTTGGVGGTISKAISATTRTSSVPGKYDLSVTQIAKSANAVSQTPLKSSIRGEKDFDAADVRAGDTFNVTLDGKTKTISFSVSDIIAIAGGATTDDKNDIYIGLLNTKLADAFGNDAGGNQLVEATFDPPRPASPNRLVINTSNEFGHALSITAGDPRNTSVDAGSTNGINWALYEGRGYHLEVTVGTETKYVTVDFTGYSGGELDSETAIGLINAALAKDGIEASFTLNTNGSLTFGANGNTYEDISIKDRMGFTLLTDLFAKGTPPITGPVTANKTSPLSALGNIPNGSNNLFDENDTLGELFTSLPFTGGPPREMEIKINGKTITLTEDDTVEEMINKINGSGASVKLEYDTLSGIFTLTSTEDGGLSKIELDGNAITLFSGELGMVDGITTSALVANIPITGQNAEFTINGTPTTRPTNKFTYNDIDFVINEIAEEDFPSADYTIVVDHDYSDAKTLITEFVDAYNLLITGLNTMVDERKARTGTMGNYSFYEPLTPDEKKEMSEREIEEWEKLAKQGVLSRDDLLSDFLSSMRNWIYESVELSDGTMLSITHIGITTSDDYKKKGTLVIDEAKLDAAFAAYGTKVGELFTKSASDTSSDNAKMRTAGIGDRLEYICDKTVGRFGTITERAGTEGGWNETNNDLYHQLQDYATRISSMLKYLTQRENHYYNMFSKMENAIMQAESQMAYLESMVASK